MARTINEIKQSMITEKNNNRASLVNLNSTSTVSYWQSFLDIVASAHFTLETLVDILQLLQRRGYLRLSECTEEQMTPCSHCSSSGSCIRTAQKGQTFIITERGKQYAKPLEGSVR